MFREKSKKIGVGLLCILGVVGVLLGGNPAAAAWKYDSSWPPIESNVDMIKGKDGAPMINLPQGEFLMGANDGPSNERPEHAVYFDSYYIDQLEVTMERYQHLLR